MTSLSEDQELYEETQRALYFLEKQRGYRYVEHVARGGYGIVVTMYDDLRRSPIAVKCTADPGDMELQKWPSFRHPNVVPLLETIMLDCCVVFIMPLYRKDLWTVSESDHFYEDTISYDLCRVWFKDVLRGLAYLHERSLSHLDIKLDNAFVKDNGHVCIGDFSLMTPSEEVTTGNAFLEHFQPPEFTPYFEELSGQKPEDSMLRGDTADIWEFGIFVIDLLTNRKISIEKNSSFEVWKYDVYPYLQKFVYDFSYLRHCLRHSFVSKEFESQDFVSCQDFLTKTLSVTPADRISARAALKHEFTTICWPRLPRPTGGMPVLLEEDKSRLLLRPSTEMKPFADDDESFETVRAALENLMVLEESSPDLLAQAGISSLLHLRASSEEPEGETDQDEEQLDEEQSSEPLPVAGPSTAKLVEALPGQKMPIKKKKKKKKIIKKPEEEQKAQKPEQKSPKKLDVRPLKKDGANPKK